MFSEQDGKCKICGRDDSSLTRGLAVDHCHSSQAVRGLLCARCNLSIGQFEDNPELLRRAARYVETAGGETYGGGQLRAGKRRVKLRLGTNVR